MSQETRPIDRLLAVMARLRDPRDGCPWDVAQDFATIAPYTIEEAYEVAGAIEDRDWDGLKDELGDLLLQVVLHARMAQEQGAFDFGDVVESITAKLLRRHPHVFGDAVAEPFHPLIGPNRAPVLLRPSRNRGGLINTHWRVIVNTSVETEVAP